jgi:predicted phosphate transport protein (TIGR00153 family)
MAKSPFLAKIRRALGGEGTTLEGVIDAMGREREEQVLERLAQFIDQVVVMVEQLQDVVERFAAERYEALAEEAKELDALESRADDAKEAILDQVSLGGVFPMHRADLARLVASMDNIANLATGAADRISMRRFTLPKEMNEQLVAMAKVDVEAVRALREAVVAMSTDLHKAIKLAGSVDKIESRADDIFATMYRCMFDMDIDFKTFHQLKAIIDRLENIADRCNDNAELLRHMALEYLEDA